jgi:signal transduction histidine kinase
VIAIARPIGDTPWLLLGELPSGPVLASARRFLARAATLTILLVLAGGLLGWTMSRRITRPLEQLTTASERIAEGDTTSRVEVDRPDELGRLSVSFNAMAKRIGEMQADLLGLVRHYRPLFERNPLPMWLEEPASRRVVEVNDAAVAHYSYDRETFGRMSARDFVIQSKPQGRGGMRLERHVLANGAVIDVEVTRHSLVEDGRDVFLVLANDVTQRLHADRALKEFNAELERRVAERTAELAAANQEMEAFSYSVSHDLRAPLRAIDGFARIVEEDHAAALPPEARECLAVISSNARKMGQLIDDLLRLARLSRKALVRIPVDMTELAHSLAFEARTGEPDRQLHFEIGDLPPAEAEPALVRQVLSNLLQNASKFSATRESARIQVGHRQDGDESVYFVRDNGVGFDMKYADKLFGVFQRLHTDEEFDGTGVGLAIVERIVHRHGGRVWAESEPDAGATFYFTLPGEVANA